MQNLYYPVKVEFLIKDNFFDSDIYLKVGDNYIHYLNAGELNKIQLEKLRDKQCCQVYLNKAGLQQYMVLKKSLLEKELNKDKSPENCLAQFHNNYELLKEFYSGIVEDEFKAEYIQDIGKASLAVLENNAYLNSLFLKFKDESPDQMVFKQLVAFFSIFSLKYFDQIPEETLEKYNVAILMTDFFLEKEDVVAHYVEYSEKIPSKYLSHPNEAITKLPKDRYFESSVIINLIKNHHESPTGRGYPTRMSCTRFDVFLCSYVIAEKIVFKLLEKGLRLNQAKEIYQEVFEEYRKFSTPNFQRAFDNYAKFLGKGI